MGDIKANTGGAFVAFTGQDGHLVTIDSVAATAKDADVSLTAGRGGIAVTTLTAARDLTVQVAGTQNAPSLRLGNTTAGGNVTLGATAGNIDQMADASFNADGKAALTTLSAGGDITLMATTNDMARLTVLAGSDVRVNDRDSLDLYDVTVAGTFDLRTGDHLTVREDATVRAGGTVDLLVASGLLDLRDGVTVAAGANVGLVTQAGDLRGLGDTTITAGKSIQSSVAGDVTFEKASTLQAGADLGITLTGSFAARGTTTLTATTGAAKITSQGAGGITLADTTKVTAAMDVSLTAASGNIAVSGQTTLSSSNGTTTLRAATGGLNLSGTSTLAGDDVVLTAQTGLAVSGQTRVTADTGAVAVTVSAGDITLTGTTTLTAQTDATLRILGAGDIAMSGSTAITTATGDLAILQTRGDLSFRDSSALTAARDISVRLAQGDLSTSSATTLTGGRDITVAVDGTATLIHRSILTAARTLDISATGGVKGSGLTDLLGGQKVQVAVAKGDSSFINTAKVQSDQGSVAVDIVDGDLSLRDDASIVALKTVSITIETGDLSGSDQTRVAATDAISLNIGTGSLTLTDDASIKSGVCDSIGSGTVTASIGTGDIMLSQNAVISSHGEMAIAIGTGDMVLSDAAALVAGGCDTPATPARNSLPSIAVSIETGDLVLTDTSNITADEELSIDMGTGKLELYGNATLRAGTSLDINIARGNLTMEDAETLITAQDVTIRVLDGLRPGEHGDVRIDLIVAGNSTRIEAPNGAILDNTASELVDNIVSPALYLVAGHGIGAEWEDNLNTNTQLLSAINLLTGGINIQNRTGLTIAPEGVRNFAAGDVVLIANGPISYTASGYSDAALVEPGSIYAMPGQRLIVLNYQGQPYFDQHWGNLSRIQVLQAISGGGDRATALDAFEMAFSGFGRFFSNTGLFDLSFFDYGRDAFDRFLNRFDFFEEDDEDVIRPVKMAEYLLQIFENDIAMELEAQQRSLEDAAETEMGQTPAQSAAATDAKTTQTAAAPEGTPDSATDDDGVALLPQPEHPDGAEGLVFHDRSGDTQGVAMSGADQAQTADRPVILQAMLLADDEIDMPLIAAE